MLLTQLGNANVYVSFEYVRDEKSNPRDTYCHVQIVDPVSGTNTETWGKAILSPKDKFCRTMGRKKAFGRAITALFPNRTKELNTRAKLWYEFRETFGV